MASTNQAPQKFRGDRVIYLHEGNIGVDSREEVIEAIEKLRGKAWLCSYGAEAARPFHLCFNDPEVFQEFKKDAEKLGIKLISKVFTEEDMDKVEEAETKINDTAIKEPNATYHDSAGKLKVEKN
jgi:hypothetical protein